MTARLDQVKDETIHDLKVELDEVRTHAISLQASLDAMTGELDREHAANAKLIKERDHFKAFGVEMATRLITVREAVDNVLKAAELAAYKPPAVNGFKEPPAEDPKLAEIAAALSPNGAQHEQA